MADKIDTKPSVASLLHSPPNDQSWQHDVKRHHQRTVVIWRRLIEATPISCMLQPRHAHQTTFNIRASLARMQRRKHHNQPHTRYAVMSKHLFTNNKSSFSFDCGTVSDKTLRAHLELATSYHRQRCKLIYRLLYIYTTGNCNENLHINASLRYTRRHR